LVFAIERDAFVTAVTGHAESSRQAGSIVDERLEERSLSPEAGGSPHAGTSTSPAGRELVRSSSTGSDLMPSTNP
jgi:hypothetical protein